MLSVAVADKWQQAGKQRFGWVCRFKLVAVPGHSRFSGVAVKFKCLSKRKFQKIKLVGRACSCAAYRAASQHATLHPSDQTSMPPCALDTVSA